MKFNHLSLSWSISRGCDTYGYNICRLDSRETGKRYKCMGGGYDMVGTVFGDWLAAEHQEALQAFAAQRPQVDCNYYVVGYKKVEAFCGLTINPNGSVSLDGACGIESMIRIAQAIGLDVEREYIQRGPNRGDTLGWYVSQKEGAHK